jgi:hypothetical protein
MRVRMYKRMRMKRGCFNRAIPLAVGGGEILSVIRSDGAARGNSIGGEGQVQQMAEPPLYHDVRLGL